MTKKIPLDHPGIILREEFLEPYSLTAGAVAELIGVDRRRIYDIVNGKREISADTALRFGLLFKTTASFWLNLQSDYNLRLAKNEKFTYLEKKITPLVEVLT